MMRKITILIGLALRLALGVATLHGPASAQDLALVGGKLYASPTADAVDDATVLIHDGIVAAVGGRSVVKLPTSARVIDCKGKTITAGFWNSHVHFETGWQNAPDTPAAKLESQMREMLTRWGFTAVWDLGSNPQNTMTIRKRVESGEVPGPRIFMAGDIFPKGGHPVYLPAEMQLTEAGTASEAEQEARDYIKMGLDGIKLFTGAYMGNNPVVNMSTPVVKAAVDVAHAQRQPVFTHPQNRAGVDNALAGGVDILAHTIPVEGRYTEDELAQMKRQHVALVPTLTLWTVVFANPQTQNKSTIEAGVAEVKQYSSQGGTILFGTDVGFQTTYDTTQEFELMGGAMSWREILASLTTSPSEFFRAAGEGRVERGMRADLVVLDADPAEDVRNFAKVADTIRDGKVIYSEQSH
jgi:imidazolonepropionase-like amidohydrolase